MTETEIIPSVAHTVGTAKNSSFFLFLPYFMEASYHCVQFFLTGLSKIFPVKGETADVLRFVGNMLYAVTVQFLPGNL